MNDHEKLVINQLQLRMESNPEDYMMYQGIPYTTAQMIEEIKKGSKVGKTLVSEMTTQYWEQALETLPGSG